MKESLLKYATSSKKQETPYADAGPIITISREFGCPSIPVAYALCDALNKEMIDNGQEPKWRVLTKEILDETANRLKTPTKDIEYIFDSSYAGVLKEILASFSKKYYDLDQKIRQTLVQVVNGFASEGYVILVGRAGVAITRDIPRSLHLRLIAPISWRMEKLSAKFDWAETEAKRNIIDFDKKRENLRSAFRGERSDDSLFDLILNCMTLSQDEIVNLIMHQVYEKKFIR